MNEMDIKSLLDRVEFDRRKSNPFAFEFYTKIDRDILKEIRALIEKAQDDMAINGIMGFGS